MASNPPVEVQAFGQSIWIDNIRRKLLHDGTFRKLIDEYGVLGVTSNPTIFQKAIGGSDDYDAAMQGILGEDADVIYERLAVEDIQMAADLFRPVYERTGGRDGYVSLEVSPLLAHRTDETVAEAKRLFAEVGRPNVMIKIPATPEGLPAIEQTIAAGINVNVTLIFAVKNYIDVAEAYIRGLEQRLAAGEDVTQIASVASFFLSRIDTMIDQMLENNIRAAQGRDIDRVQANSKLLGKAAIANAKLAYKRFVEMFYGERFAKLRRAGAAVQRPLWASTGTKNPAYPDTLYIDSLIGRDTVNTVPPATLDAFRDHGSVAETLTQDADDLEALFDMLAEVGVDIDQVTQRLQDDGVEAFVDSFRALLDQVEAKRQVLATGVMAHQKTALGVYSEAVKAAFRKLDAEYANSRIWAKEGSLWKDHGPTIAKIQNRLGWLDFQQTIDLARLKALQASARNGDFDHVVLLGMGGSSLAPEVLSLTFGSAAGFPKLLMLDSTLPERVLEIERAVNLKRTLFIVASKSGSTIETKMFYEYFYDKTGKNGAQFIAITDPGSELAATATAAGFRDVFLNPEDIGGRYSALSYFGLVPAALIGLDLDALWESATAMVTASSDKIVAEQHPGAHLGAIIGALAQAGRDKLSLFTSPSIGSFGNWVEQLVAESTGKEGVGVVPVVGATAGMPHDYASDRLFVYLKVEDDPNNAELDERIKALREAGHPRVTLMVKDRYALGGEFFRWEYATAIAGKILGINPFDEPNVTESKENTGRLLKHYVEHGALPAQSPILTGAGVGLYAAETTLNPLRELCAQHGYNNGDVVQVLGAQIAGTMAGDYFALLAYLPPSEAVEEKLQLIRRRLRHVTLRAVTIGYGPRYLHSTGQLHKGGANNGVFFQFTHDDAEDAPIPGAPYSFKVLKDAQAAGDLEALNTHKRRALRVHLGRDVLGGLDVVLSAIDFVENRRK
jgi:transaldolase/glucose-6-phosphate isomerase